MYKFSAAKWASANRSDGIPPFIRKLDGHPARFMSGVEVGRCGILEVYRDECEVV